MKGGFPPTFSGGLATADWLEENLINYIDKFWQGKSTSVESDITDASSRCVLLPSCALSRPVQSWRPPVNFLLCAFSSWAVRQYQAQSLDHPDRLVA